ncbi:MAG TPA: hypothetical protein PKV56_18710 [Burkholderiaceae bacterium]|nr:hypothetical protein [Burkholderiaceae bacterium]
MNTTPQPDPRSSIPPTEEEALADRRRAILRGLGKGGVALAALSPVVSHATRSFKVKNPDLLPASEFGYCTVSGFQSAAISGSPTAVECGAFEPDKFVGPLISLDYDALIATHASTVPAASTYRVKLATALNGYYGTGTNLTGPNIGSTLRATPAVKLVINTTNTKTVIVPGLLGGAASRTSGTELRPTTDFPQSVNPTQSFNSLFPSSSDARTLLEVLQDGVASNNPTSANCYVLATYLSVGASGASLPPSLDRAYIQAQYTASSYGSSTNLYKFFRSVCLG